MAKYVYACENKKHPRREVEHGMQFEPEVFCEACGGVMKRVPQAFRFYMDPQGAMLDRFEKKFEDRAHGKQSRTGN